MVWKQINSTGAHEIESVDCIDLIWSLTDLSEAEKEEFLHEVPEDKNYICPNVTSFQVEGGKI